MEFKNYHYYQAFCFSIIAHTLLWVVILVWMFFWTQKTLPIIVPHLPKIVSIKLLNLHPSTTLKKALPIPSLEGIQKKGIQENTKEVTLSPHHKAVLFKLRNKIASHLRYPKRFRQQGMQGRVELQILLDPQGGLKKIEILKKSEQPQLDQWIVASIKTMAPFQEIQEATPAFYHPAIQLHLPVEFKIHSSVFAR